MKNKLLNDAVRAYLIATGQANAPVAGGVKLDNDSGRSNILFERLRDSQKQANRIIAAAICCLVLLFLVAMVIIIRHMDSPSIVLGILGGNIFSTLIIVWWLRKMWLEKSAIDTLLTLAADMPPASGAKLILEFYFNRLNQDNLVRPPSKSAAKVAPAGAGLKRSDSPIVRE